MSLLPAPPAFDRVRLATGGDLSRIALVAAAAFHWSPVFQFQRPYFADFPDDTFASYFAQYKADIDDPATVVIVTEDAVNEREGEFVYEALRKAPLSGLKSDPNTKVIVGVCSIDLKAGSARIGQFQPNHVHLPRRGFEPKTQHRDQHAGAVETYSRLSGPAKSRYLVGQMRLSTLAVHPAYWRRGHGSRLVNWCIQLANVDVVSVGVSAAPTGVDIALKFGFKERAKIHIKGYTVKRRLPTQKSESEQEIPGLELWIGVRPPRHQILDIASLEGGLENPVEAPFPFWATQSLAPQVEDISL